MLEQAPVKRRVSYSELKCYKRCKRQWYYKYVRKLSPIYKTRPLQIGKFIHKAMEVHYSNGDWKAALQEMYESNVNEINNSHMFLEEKEHYIKEANQNYLDAVDLMERYIKHDAKDPLVKPGWKVLAVEQEFTAVLPGTDCEMFGYIDMVLEDENGNIWGVEHKNGEQFFDVEQLVLDEQASIYITILRMQYGERAKGFIYNLLRTKKPSVPKLTKANKLSKAAIDTTWDVYLQAILDHGLDPADYADMKVKLENVKFFNRDYIYRTPAEINNFVRDLVVVVNELAQQDPDKCYRTAMRSCQWDCHTYNQLCVMEMKGLDTDYYILHSFKTPKNDGQDEPNDDMQESSFGEEEPDTTRILDMDELY